MASWIGTAVFAQMTSVPIADNGAPLSHLKINPSHGGFGPPNNTWFLGPTRVLNAKAISISAAVFAG